jgi:hypothetical protein
MPIRDMGAFAHRRLNRSAIQQNVFAIAPPDLSIFNQLCHDAADHWPRASDHLRQIGRSRFMDGAQ